MKCARALFESTVTDVAMVSRDGWVIFPTGLFHRLGSSELAAGTPFHWLENRADGDDVRELNARLVALSAARAAAEPLRDHEEALHQANDVCAAASAEVCCDSTASYCASFSCFSEYLCGVALRSCVRREMQWMPSVGRGS